jgi:DNA-binding NtrC family response regulator
VRELKSLIERMVVLAKSDRITLDDLPEEIRRPRASAANVFIELPFKGFRLMKWSAILSGRRSRCGGNQTRTARYLTSHAAHSSTVCRSTG